MDFGYQTGVCSVAETAAFESRVELRTSIQFRPSLFSISETNLTDRVVSYGAEALTLTKKEEQTLLIF